MSMAAAGANEDGDTGTEIRRAMCHELLLNPDDIKLDFKTKEKKVDKYFHHLLRSMKGADD